MVVMIAPKLWIRKAVTVCVNLCLMLLLLTACQQSNTVEIASTLDDAVVYEKIELSDGMLFFPSPEEIGSVREYVYYDKPENIVWTE